MNLILGHQAIELLDPNPDYDSLPTGQAEAYRLLLALGEGWHSEQGSLKRSCHEMQLALISSENPLFLRFFHKFGL